MTQKVSNLIFSSKQKKGEMQSINDDAYDFILGLYNLHNENIKKKTTSIPQRIKILNDIKNNIQTRIQEIITNKSANEEKTFWDTIEQIEKDYLLEILDDVLNIKIDGLEKGEITHEIALNHILKEIGYFDSELFLTQVPIPKQFKTIDDLLVSLEGRALIKKLFNENQEFTFSYLIETISNNALRDKLIKGLFNHDYDAYFSAFQAKLSYAAKTLFKQLLFLKLLALNNDEIKQAILYITIKLTDVRYKNDIYKLDNIVFALFNTKYSLNMIKNGQRGLCDVLKIINNSKLKGENNFTRDEKHILAIITYLKSNPQEKLVSLNKRLALSELKHLCALDKPTALLFYMENACAEIFKKLKNTNRNNLLIEEDDMNRVHKPQEPEFISHLCNEVTNTVILTYETLVKKEQQIIQELKIKRIKEIIINCLNPSLKVLLVFLLAFTLKFGYSYFFDIENIYKNKFYKETHKVMEAIPYPTQIKDSLNPTVNETMQKKRLNNINALNTRYFKPIELFLNPDLGAVEINNAIQDLFLPLQLNTIEGIAIVRKELSLLNKTRWQFILEPMLGSNIFTELRAYGEVANFLMPPLAHFVIKDEQGFPIRANSEFKIYYPPSEIEILKNNFISMFNQSPLRSELEPKIYIRKYDDNYKKTVQEINKLLEEIKNKKNQTIKSYKKTKDLQKKTHFKNTLIAIAILESRLIDLKSKVNDRFNEIVKNNSYRVPME
ncbi:MAG: hypothetical protein HYR97_00885 [Candidatus Melainabacteria bacterium]|nr:hypothetical protein [Candidatus Melainabacteria bacterium]